MNLNENAEATDRAARRRRNFIQPGSVLGVLGGGQLGRMFALDAARLGYRVHVFDPEANCPAGQVSAIEVNAPYSDEGALKRFAGAVDAVTYEFENIPLRAIEVIAELAPVRPRGEVLHICQHREREKNFLAARGIPCAPFWVVDSAEELADALRAVDGPGVLKTAEFGYDGKGQMRVRTGDDPHEVWTRFGRRRAVLEGWVDFTHELSVICARGLDGATSVFPVIENRHTDHILDFSIIPSRVPEAAQAEARSIAQGIVAALDIAGILAVEFFLSRDGRLLVNELAPRPHNSGHFSLDACVTSQFEQQVRAVCGLPLGSTELLRPAAMLNLLGDLWKNGEPAWDEVLAEPDVKLHLYGKDAARLGRKMGHICVLADSADEALRRAERIKASLSSA
ncbi:MAG: 5-(carboxyamino)imidazole ribonucleotide synthase [Terrimicrobiaceae bacterium]|nr:5-(carboxyamino)imidazole ribonucleotide synthase [Terrimicrobiaceae bacterium]